MLATTKMKCDGFYDTHSHTQSTVFGAMENLIHLAALRVPLPAKDEAFWLVDYGSSEGRNSVNTMKTLIGRLEARRAGMTYQILHNDLPLNDFNRLFKNIYSTKRSYLDDSNNIIAFASAESFYKQVAPSQSVRLGLSSCAVHWLSRMPEFSIRRHISHHGATAREKQALAAIAARDWENFLHARACEMAPGARLVVNMAGRVEHFKQTPVYSAQKLFELINESCLNLLESGKIKALNYERFALPIYCRSVDEVVKPFIDPASPLRNLLTVEYAAVDTVPCPNYARYLEDGNRQAYADAVVGTLRAFAEPLILENLVDGDHMLLEEIFFKISCRIKESPDDYVFAPVTVFLLACRH